MGLMDFQLGVKDESVYGTPVTVDRFFEYESENIAETYGRTQGDPLRVGSSYMRSDRFTPYFSGAAGTVQLAVLTKGFGFWLKHMLGDVATTGPTDGAYTHTGSEGTLEGKSFTLQVNRPLNPSGTNQAFTYEGGKITEWTLSNTVDGNLLLDLGMDFENVLTNTALASASYPSDMDNLSWAGGVVSIAGSPFDVTEVSIAGDNGLNVDRRQIRGNTDKKEPTSSRREATFSLSADFSSMAERNRAAADTKAGALASLSVVWTGPTLIGAGATYPSLTVTCAEVRFDEWSGATEGTDAITQTLSGAILFDGTNSPVEIAYVTEDSTP